MITRKQKAEKLSSMTTETLLKTYKWYIDHFDPLSDDINESYKMVEEEIVRRIEEGR